MTALMTIPRNTKQWYETIKSLPTLPIEREHQLFNEYKNGCLKSRDELLQTNIQNVFFLALKFRRETHPLFPEMVQEGCIGLLKSLDGFDPSRGFKFFTFARNTVKSAISSFLFKNRSVLADPRTKMHRDLYFNMSKYHDVSEPISTEKAEKIANILNENKNSVETRKTTAQDIIDFVENAQKQIFAIDLPVKSNDGGNSTFHDILPSNLETPFEHYANEEEMQKITQGYELLDDREKEIINRTSLQAETETNIDIANDWGISHQRVGQLKERAIKKLREHVTA